MRPELKKRKRSSQNSAGEAAPASEGSDGAAQASIGFLLQRAHNMIRANLVKVLEGTGLHLGHVAILGFLVGKDGRTQKELSEQTGIEKSSMVLFLDHLEGEGWIRRQPHPTDRRAHAIILTATGERRLRILGPQLHNAEEEMLHILSGKERRQLQAGLRKLVSQSEGFK